MIVSVYILCHVYTAPEAVTGLTIDDQTNTSISLSWSLPDPQHHTSIQVAYTRFDGNQVTPSSALDAGTTNVTLDSLDSGYEYSISVEVQSGNVTSAASVVTFYTSRQAGPLSPDSPPVCVLFVSNSTSSFFLVFRV